MLSRSLKEQGLGLVCTPATIYCESCYSPSVHSIPFPFTELNRSLAPNDRRHGPSGYSEYSSYKPWLRDEYDFRCVYCLAREAWDLNATSAASGFGVDHMRSQHDAPDEVTNYDNLCYCCNECNRQKGAKSLPERLIKEPLATHLRFNEDGSVEALTKEGAWLRDCVFLAHPEAVQRRQLILDLRSAAMADLAAGHDSPKARMFQYPSELENLATRNPPKNSRMAGLEDSAWARRERGELSRFF